MSKWTPGPWGLETAQTQVGICYKIGPFPNRDGKVTNACVYVDYPGDGPREWELLANARLIAAAPEMAELLEQLVSADEEAWDADSASGFLSSLATSARALLDKVSE